MILFSYMCCLASGDPLYWFCEGLASSGATTVLPTAVPNAHMHWSLLSQRATYKLIHEVTLFDWE
jgi:hypothetical protein